MDDPIDLEEYEKIQPAMVIPMGNVKVVYATPNAMTGWRVKTFFTKEPETIAWMGEFGSGEVMVDVGANVGMYSIWAAKTRGVRVFAFEPGDALGVWVLGAVGHPAVAVGDEDDNDVGLSDFLETCR